MKIIKNFRELYDYKGSLVFFDLETTGLSAVKERIIEIGAIKVVNNKIVERYSSLVNPGIEVPYYSTKVNGITTEMLQGKISDQEGVNKLLDMFTDAIVVAHNVNFDTGFINEYLRRADKPQLENRLVDTVRMARKAFPGRKKYSLGVIAAELGIDVRDAHRAEDDARVCYELYNRSISSLKEMES